MQRMDTAKKQDLLNEKAEQYRTMDTAKRQDLLMKNVEQYKRMDTAKKQDLLNKKAEQYKIINGHCLKQDLLNTKTEQDRTMDATKKQKILEKSKERIYLQKLSKAIQGRLPCQAIVNNLNVDDVPTELGNLKKTRTNINCTAHHIWKRNSYPKRATKEN